MEDDDSVRVLDCQGPQQAGAPHMQTEAKRARHADYPRAATRIGDSAGAKRWLVSGRKPRTLRRERISHLLRHFHAA